ncbi:hypothetical protein GF354_03395 [Candidatus Peregrinibacteria bacterium]|nr:hypothetical protein [Candidatus Peregrinibacteria bacterium]
MQNPINILIEEHKLITRFLSALEVKVKEMETENRLDEQFIDIITDFFGSFIDRSHHGKEEDIFFKILAQKELDAEMKEIIIKLENEHEMVRKYISQIIKSKSAYLNGDLNALKTIILDLNAFLKLYPQHIKIENDYFFENGIKYLSVAEQEEMQNKFNTLHPPAILQKYIALVDNLEAK